ncbi:MAG TPA: hypothetical protein VFH90_04385, partial [Candidatus Limnocylindria bacterium]|nr:hypothetical protein [Candidatus Limnocylindria bacterium]
MSRRPAPRGAHPNSARPGGASRRMAPSRGLAVLPAVILAASAAIAGALFIGLMGVYAAYTTGLPTVTDIENFELNEGSRVMSADGVELATFASERRQVVPFDQIPQLLIDAQ